MRTVKSEHLARLAAWDHHMRRIRDWLLTAAMVWCLLALAFSLTAIPVLGFIVTVGAYVGLAALAVFAALSLLIASVEIRLARNVVRGKREEAVSLLLQILDSEGGRTRLVAGRALTRALPAIRSLSAAELEEVHNAVQSADPGTEAPLMVALLDAMGRMGDSRSLAIAGEIGASKAMSRAEVSVRNAAKRCGATLERRLGESASASASPPHHPAPAG